MPPAIEDVDARLARLLRPRPLATWSAEEIVELARLQRAACTELARLEADGEDRARARRIGALLGEAQELLGRDERRETRPIVERLAHAFLVEAPRAIRAEWRLLSATLALVYGLAALAWSGVAQDLDRAYALLDPSVVDHELEQLAALAEGQPFRGNFTFGLGESPVAAGAILMHNIGVGILFFASALLPPLYLYMLGSNALMLGTYTAVAGHFGQAGAISSILWTHGVLEIQALVLVGTAGLVLVRAWVRPGAYTRTHALLRESRRALALFTPVFPLLVVAGLIEGFVSPHAPLGARLAVAIGSGVALVAWVALGGRGPRGESPL